MYPLEVLFATAVLIMLFAQIVQGVPRQVLLTAFVAALATVLLSILSGQIRWQMAPAYLLFVTLSLLLLRRSYSHVAVRAIGGLVGFLLLGVAVTLSLALPIVTLPAPNGPHVVGSKSFWLLDESRNEAYFGVPDGLRELSIRVWYPAAVERAQAQPYVRTLWEDMYRGPRDGVSILLGYLRGVKTHTYEDLPLSTDSSSYPLVVFSHSLGLNAEQNTPLMEHLASHGYIVIGVNHTRMTLRVVSSQGHIVYADPVRTNEAFAEGAAIDDGEVGSRLAHAGSARERAEIVFALGERATSMNEQVAIRADDLRFVLGAMTEPEKAPAELATLVTRIDSNRIGLVGMSLGGATVLDVCKTDSRCRAGINLDGGLFGQHQREPLQVPFLSMISAPNQKYGEHLLVGSMSDYYEVLVEGAGHGDFSDMTFLMPFMKWLGANGRIAPERAVEIVNAVSRRFFDAYLRDGLKPRFDAQEFPELRVTMNDYADS